jgi:hypothetical protein
LFFFDCPSGILQHLTVENSKNKYKVGFFSKN